MPSVVATAIAGIPEIEAGDDLAGLLWAALADSGADPRTPWVVVVSSKVVSKALGLRSSGERTAVIASQSRRVVAERVNLGGLTRIVEAAAGPVMAAAGVDASNTGGRADLLLLPTDPDAQARRLMGGLLERRAAPEGGPLAVIVSDTAGRPWRAGQVDFALGSAGIRPMLDHRGEVDHDGRTLSVTTRCLADELASLADLVKGKAEGIPAALVTGCPREWFDEDAVGAASILRTGPGDWFALGHFEAARAALGIEPGSALAEEVGVADVAPEPVADRLCRALRAAVVGETDTWSELDDSGQRVHLQAPTAYALGRLSARLEVALWAEGLRAASEDPGTPRTPPTAGEPWSLTIVVTQPSPGISPEAPSSEGGSAASFEDPAAVASPLRP